MADATPYNTPKQIRKNFAAWYAAMEASHAMLMAGLRNQVGVEGDIHAAYRQWQADRRARKLRDYEHAYQCHLKRVAAQIQNGRCDAT